MKDICANQLLRKLSSWRASVARSSAGLWLSVLLAVLCSARATASAPYPQITIINDAEGSMMLVDGKPFMINGMNWDYFPIGTNHSYSLWSQPDDVIREALDKDMSLLRDMGVNAIRQHVGVPARWVRYIYEKYGIWTMIYDSFGRYGLTIDGVWHPNTDYEDPKVARVLLRDAMSMVREYNNTPGILMYMLGNENNYGLFWKGAEAEDLPVADRNSTKQARALYKVMNEAAVEMKKLGATAPIAICNGDLMFLDIISKECSDIDLLGVNVYRGASFGDLFDRVKAEYGKPVFFAEFGSDAYNARTQQEAQKEQADILVRNWNEIYSNARGLGKAGNAIGGFTFQFADGWWKHGQDINLDTHDTTASWGNEAYGFDYIPGQNNMNEEWFGICAKGQPDDRGIYELYPRAAYYALKDVHKINPYAKGRTVSTITGDIDKVDLTSSVLQARGDKAALESEKAKLFSISELRGDFSTFTTGASRTTTPKKRPDAPSGFPSFKGFDHMESFYIGVKATPSPKAEAEVTVNVLGNVAENPIDEIFYENRGRSRYVVDDNGQFVDLGPLERVKIYSASLYWDANLFTMNVFYRKPHYHWGDEGDFFGFYPEASYGDFLDIYGGEAPFGAEFEGKKFFKGLKLAFGPELWWGANPAARADRTRLLKPRPDETMLQIYDMQLCEHGKAIHARRQEFAERLQPVTAAYYSILSGDREQVELHYKSELNDRPFEEILLDARQKDIVNEFTTAGIHRDDLVLKIGGYPLRKYGSQGQQKSFLIALKLAQYAVVAQTKGERPILLLDDLFDKLDAGRVEQLIRLVSDDTFGQILITDCNPTRLKRILDKAGGDYTLFSVAEGAVTQERAAAEDSAEGPTGNAAENAANTPENASGNATEDSAKGAEKERSVP